MKKFISLLLTFTLCCSVFLMTSCEKDDDGDERYENSYPTEYVRLSDGVSADMMRADYWIERAENAGSVLMTADQIASFNSKNSKLIRWGDEDISLNDVPETADGDAVRYYLEEKMPEDPTAYYINGKKATKEYFDAIDANRALDTIGDTVKIRFGFSVRRAELRTYPTNDFGVTDPDDLFYDDLLSSQCLPYLPVVILHESADGNWYYVFFNGFGGWVSADAIALCESREDWLKRQTPTEFLVVTGREIRLPYDQGCKQLSSLLLPMGTVLPLVKTEDAPFSVRMRIGYGCYTVLLPIRGDDGMIKDEYAFVSASEDVSVGYIPYTSENVIRQAFKLSGDRYGWGGSGYSNDCSGVLGEIFRCFGFAIPRVASLIISANSMKTTDLSEMTDAERMAEILKYPAGSMMFFPGHIMLYLGVVDNEPYVISSVGTFATMDMTDGDYLYADTVNINALTKTKRGSGKTWLASITVIGIPEYSD